MHTAYAPSFPDLVSLAIRQLVPPELNCRHWHLMAAAYSAQLFWVKLQAADTEDRQMMIGLPLSIVQKMLPQLSEDAVCTAWDAPEARMIELEQLSRSLPDGTHKLVIAPVASPYFGSIRVTFLY